MRSRLLVATGIALALFGVAVSAGGAYAYFWDESNSDLIASGVTVAGIDVGGLHADQARALCSTPGSSALCTGPCGSRPAD